MAVLNDFITFLIAGSVLMLVPVGLIAYFQGGFFGKWLKVKMGRGKYVLVKVRSTLRDYFEAGLIKENYVIYGKKEKTRRHLLNLDCIYRGFGVDVIDLDENTGAICKTDYSTVAGFDTEKQESLYTRALYRPTLEQERDKVVLILLGLAIAIGVIGVILTFSLSNQVASIGAGTVNNIL